MADVISGGDEQLVALYPDGSVRAGTIADLVEIAASYAEYEETAADGLPVRVYYRVDDRLADANVFTDHSQERRPNGLREITMQVLRVSPGRGVVAAASTTY